jgi:hypothetical protein
MRAEIQYLEDRNVFEVAVGESGVTAEDFKLYEHNENLLDHVHALQAEVAHLQQEARHLRVRLDVALGSCGSSYRYSSAEWDSTRAQRGLELLQARRQREAEAEAEGGDMNDDEEEEEKQQVLPTAAEEVGLHRAVYLWENQKHNVVAAIRQGRRRGAKLLESQRLAGLPEGPVRCSRVYTLSLGIKQEPGVEVEAEVDVEVAVEEEAEEEVKVKEEAEEEQDEEDEDGCDDEDEDDEDKEEQQQEADNSHGGQSRALDDVQVKEEPGTSSSSSSSGSGGLAPSMAPSASRRYGI